MLSKPSLFGATLGALALGFFACASPSGADAATAACTAFRTSFLKATSDLKSNFVRPLTVTRGGAAKGDVYDLVSQLPADVVLTCNGEKLVRFEANLTVPSSPARMAQFAGMQKAAMMSAFGWSAARADEAFHTINQEAAEYLKASIQRGDVVLAGKTEYHEGGGDLGMMYTPHRQTFVVVGDE